VVIIPVELRPHNDCAAEDQQQLETAGPFSRHKECYITTITASVHLQIKLLVVSLKELVAKTNRLAVNRQSCSKYDSNSESVDLRDASLRGYELGSGGVELRN
jgi:hypothetical protein